MKEPKTVQYKFTLTEDLRKAFIESCKNQDTAAAQELRKFMRSYVAKNGQKKLI